MLAQKCAHAGIEVPTAETHPGLAVPRGDRARMGEHARPQLPTAAATLRRFLVDPRRRVRLARGRARTRGACRGPSWAVSTRTWTRPGRSRPGDAGSRSSCSATPVPTASRSTSTTGPRQGGKGRGGSSRTHCAAPQDGNLVLFVVNDQGQLRSYRVDRIAGIRPTDETFQPASSSSSEFVEPTTPGISVRFLPSSHVPDSLVHMSTGKDT